ncbi:MAG: hypothetical protein MUP61_03720, partial [Burkholderiales bacterium]|nr:hypothetical protein [Burkholderiales bacterium]
MLIGKGFMGMDRCGRTLIFAQFSMKYQGQPGRFSNRSDGSGIPRRAPRSHSSWFVERPHCLLRTLVFSYAATSRQKEKPMIEMPTGRPPTLAARGMVACPHAL